MKKVYFYPRLLLLIPQRYEFSSKSQQLDSLLNAGVVVADTTKVRIFKQITTIHGRGVEFNLLLLIPQRYEFSSKSQPLSRLTPALSSCCWYHKGTNFQANHNYTVSVGKPLMLLLIPQRYEFSSKSQQTAAAGIVISCCCWYHKGTNFQANHNKMTLYLRRIIVVADTTKVRIFKQITTWRVSYILTSMLLLIPQRYEFSSKSQLFRRFPV